MADKQSALRRSLSEAAYVAQYLAPLTEQDEDDTQAKNRRAAAQQVRLRRTLVLFAVVLAICLLTACAAVVGKSVPVPHVPSAPVMFTKDASFGDLLRARKKAEEKDMAEAEEVIEVQAGTARKGLCLQCSLNGFCEEDRCRCQPPWTGPTCSTLGTVAHSSHVALKAAHRIVGLFPIQDRHSGSYHLFFGLQDNAFDDKDLGIAHAVSASPAWGYRLLSRVTFATRKPIYHPWVVWLPVSELYLMFFSEADCAVGAGQECQIRPAAIRVAFTANLTAEWTLAARPVLQGKGTQEGQRLTNPAALVHPLDESITLLYRGEGGLSVARATKWNAEYRRQSGNPVLPAFKSDGAFAWVKSGAYHVLGYLRQQDIVVHGYSRDALQWSLDGEAGLQSGLNISHPVAPYHMNAEVKIRTRNTLLKRRDTPALLFEGGAAAYLFSAVPSTIGRTLIIATELARPAGAAREP